MSNKIYYCYSAFKINHIIKKMTAVLPFLSYSNKNYEFNDNEFPQPEPNCILWFGKKTIHDTVSGDINQILIFISNNNHIKPFYIEISKTDKDGKTDYFVGVPNEKYDIELPKSENELKEFTRPVLISGCNKIICLPYFAVCVSNTLRNMIVDIGLPDGVIIPIGDNIIIPGDIKTIQFFQMMMVCGYIKYQNIIQNWNFEINKNINFKLHIPEFDNILKTNKNDADKKTDLQKEEEIKKIIPNYSYNEGWCSYDTLEYFINSVDYLDIPPLLEYFTYTYSIKLGII